MRVKAIREEDYPKLVDMYHSEMDLEDITAYFGCSKGSVYKYLREAGYKPSRRGNIKGSRVFTLVRDSELIAIGTAEDIAEQIGIKPKNVMHYSTPTYKKRSGRRELTCIDAYITKAKRVKEAEIKKIIKDSSYRYGEVVGYYDEEYDEYCICDNTGVKPDIDFYSKIDMYKEGYKLEGWEPDEL